MNKVSFVAVAAAMICLAVYIRTVTFEFINWDDPLYVVENQAIKVLDWQFVKDAFTTTYLGWWMPLTWLSLAIDYHFWALNPSGYHLSNSLLHTANTGLVVLLADRLLSCQIHVRNGNVQFPACVTVKSTANILPSHLYYAALLLAGLMWGLHPLRVESVAWVTERKDVLNGFFAFGSLLFYLRYVQSKDCVGKNGVAFRNYMYSLIALLLSLLAKPVSVVLPFMLLILDWYPLERFRKYPPKLVIGEKIPFILLVASVSLFTVQFASENQILISLHDLSLANRALLAGNSLYEYCKLSLFPINIIHLYLLPWPLPISYFYGTFFTICLTGCSIWHINKKKWFIASWALFVLPLIPVSGFFQNGAQSHAARFTYLSAAIPTVCAAGLFMILYNKLHGITRTMILILIIITFSIYGITTVRLVGSWRTSETLWSRVISITPIGRAYYLRADYYSQVGRYAEAIKDLSRSIEMGENAGYPEVFNLYALRGVACIKLKLYSAAIKDFSKAIALHPNPSYYYQRGLASRALGLNKQSDDDFMRSANETGKVEWQKAQ